MLVQIIILVALIATLSAAVLENGLRAATVVRQTSVARYADVAISDGVAEFGGDLARYVRAHGTRGPWPQAKSESFPSALCDAETVRSCAFSYTVASRITSASSADAGAATGTGDTALNLQQSAIDEQRISAVVSATITSQAGIVLGRRTRLLTYRVFNAPPYAVASGALATSAIDAARTPGQGDSGGSVARSDAAPAGTDGDTRIHVQLTCSSVAQAKPDVPKTGNDAPNDGLPWGNAAGAAYEAACHSPASSADAFGDERWSTQTASPPGWSR